MKYSSVLITVVLPASVSSFSSTLFQEKPTLQKTVPSKHDGADIELPDIDELFGRIQQVSPLAEQVISRSQKRGFNAMEKSESPELSWRTIESNKNRVVHSIEKIDNFQGLPAPLLRFRSTLEGPCVGTGGVFANLVMELDQRKRWDSQIEQVYEAYPINDLDSANIAMGFGRYGDCSRLGIGYCQTKANLGIAPREQLTLCGMQEFRDGSSIIWGVEMEEWHDHLMPEGTRFPRAKSHIFSTTLTPTGEENKFDVEYVLQLEAGGNLPTWLTTPVMVDTVKKLFKTADSCYRGKCNTLENFLEKKRERETLFAYNPSLLITP
jgi:hypothetical protein